MTRRHADFDATARDLLARGMELQFAGSCAVLAATDLAERWSPTVIAIGRGLPLADRVAVAARGCAVTTVRSIPKALALMHERVFDLIAVNPTINVEGDGVRLIRAIKLADIPEAEGETRFLLNRYRAAPCLILPLPRTDEYALYVNRNRWYLTSRDRVPIWKTIVGIGSGDN